MEIEKKETEKLKTFSKILEQINQSPKYNWSRQSQSSAGTKNALVPWKRPKTISQNTVTISR